MPTSKMKLAATAMLVAALAGPGASAFQAGAPQPRTPRESRPTVANPNPAAVPSPQERLAIIDRALAAIRQSVDKGEGDKADEELRWQRRRLDVQLQGGMPSAESSAAYLEALKSAEARAKKLHELGQLPLLAYLDAQYRLAEGERQARLFAQMGGGQGQGMPGMMGQGMSGMMGMGGAGGQGMMNSMAGQFGGGQAGQGAPAGGGQGGAIGGGGFGGGFGGDADPTPPRRPRLQHPADIERNKLIEERLNKAVAMNFASETPLEDVLKYVKEATKDAQSKAIPIYVDPIGLQNAEKTMTSTIILDLEDVPLRTTLRLILAQLGMNYRIRDGMLYISDEDALNEDDAFILPSNIAPGAAPAAPTTGNPRRLQ